MNNNNQTKVSVPQWHYRDTQAEVSNILENSRGIGSLRGALVDYIHGKQVHLPEGVTAESAVDSIIRESNGFAAAHVAGKTADDLTQALHEAVRQMKPQQAVAYLASLEATFRACDVGAANNGRVPDVTELRDQLTLAVSSVSDEEIGNRIESLAGMILGDSLKAYVYASGNDAIKEMILGHADIAETGISRKAATELQALLLNESRQADVYAATSCACYCMVLDGKIAGVSADTLDAGTLTVLVSAGLEKGTILTRLARGEIDRELALEMLEALSRVLKWALVKTLQAGVLGVTASLAIIAVSGILSGWFLIAFGLMVGVFMAVEYKEPLEKVVDFLGELTGLAMKCVCDAVSWVWNKGKEFLEGNRRRQTSIKRTGEIAR